MGRLLRVSVPTALAALLVAPGALACPYCAAGNEGGIGLFLVIASFVVFPLAVVAVVWPLVRRAGSEADLIHERTGENTP